MDDLDSFKVVIEKGTPNKHKITLYDIGGDFVDQLSSDIIVEISDQEHPFYKRKGKFDLQAEVKLTLREALLGFSKKLKHLDGHFVTLKETGVTQPNHIKKIRGEGLPNHEYPSETGDLDVIFKVQIPENFTSHQMELWAKFFNS